MLPDTLYGLLELAMEDYEKVLQDDRYEVKMAAWHAPIEEGKCEVCLAGAVMSKTLRVDIDNFAYPNSFIDTIERKLLAINALRTGDIAEAGYQIGKEIQGGDREVADYDDNPDKWEMDMHVLIDELREACL